MALLEAKHISQDYEDEKVIEDINLVLNPGEIVCLIGASGVGKTTLFQILSGLARPKSGSVLLKGEDITGQAGKISYMLQKDLLIPYMNVVDNVALPLKIAGMDKKMAREKVQEYFGTFGLEGTAKKYPSQLSGGMRQRAAFLRTYMFRNEVALLDEPFSALDAITKSEMHSWYLDVMRQIKLSTVFITHDIEEAILLSNRVYIMAGKPGRIVKEIAIEKPDSLEMFHESREFWGYKKSMIEAIKGNCKE